jgi:hypothetical protein
MTACRLTLCRTRSSSSDSSLVGSGTGAAFSAGASADCAAAAAVDEQCRAAGLEPHCALLTLLLVLLLLTLLLHVLLLRPLHLLLAMAACWMCSCAMAHGTAAVPDHAVRLLANGRYLCSSHLGASLLHAMPWLCCAVFMLCLWACSSSCR